MKSGGAKTVDRLGGMKPAFREAGFNLALDLGLDFDQAANSVTRWFKAGICNRYREGLMAKLAEYQVGDLVDVALQADMHPSQRSRYKSGQTQPLWETLFIAGTAKRVVWDGALPPGDATITPGIAAAVLKIRTELLGVTEEADCDLSVLALLRFVCFDGRWFRAQLTQDSQAQAEAVNEARLYVGQRLGRAYTATRQEMETTIAKWRNPYLLFHALIKLDWPMPHV